MRTILAFLLSTCAVLAANIQLGVNPNTALVYPITNMVFQRGMTFGNTGLAYFGLPQMTTVQRNALTATNGFLIYNTTTEEGQIYQDSAWTHFTVLPSSQTLVVDGVNGDDGTATRGRVDLPFATFDAALAVTLAQDIIWIRPGTFTTVGGVHGSTIPSGVSIVGSGQGNTTLRLVQTATTSRHSILSTTEDAASSNIYVGHLTLDGGTANVWTAPGGKVNGLILYGNDHMADHVTVLNCIGYTNTAAAYEAFSIMIGSPDYTYASGSNTIVKDCMVQTRATGSINANNTGIIAVNAKHFKTIGNIVETYGNAFGMAYGGHDGLFANNTALGCTRGFNIDTGATNAHIKIVDNHISCNGGASYGINWVATATTNLWIEGNTIRNATICLNLTNVAGGYYYGLILNDNYLSGGTGLHLSYATNSMLANNYFASGAGTVNSCSGLWGDNNLFRDGLVVSYNLIFDKLLDDLTVRGTLTATNSYLYNSAVIGLSGAGDSVPVFTDSNLDYTDNSSDFANLFDYNNGSGPLVQSSGASLTNLTLSGSITVGTQTGIAATIDVLTASSSTNRLVWVGGILVSNIVDYNP